MTKKETLEQEILKLNKQIAKESTPPAQKISFAKVKDKKQAELDAIIAGEKEERKPEPKTAAKKGSAKKAKYKVGQVFKTPKGVPYEDIEILRVHAPGTDLATETGYGYDIKSSDFGEDSLLESRVTEIITELKNTKPAKKKKAAAKEKKPKRQINDNGLSLEDCEEVLQEKKQDEKKNRKAVKKSESRSTQEKTADSLEGVLKHIVKDKKTKATAKKDPAKIKKAVKKMDSAVKSLVSALAAFGIVISASRAKKIAEILKDLA